MNPVSTKIMFGENRQILTIQFLNSEGKRNNNGDIPGEIWYHDTTGKRRMEWYYVDGIVHRDETEGPAIIEYEEDGITIFAKNYYKDGKLHRSNGEPAMITYYDGKLMTKGYWENGVLIKTEGEENF